MENWTIRAAPSPRDAQRHELLLKGSMKEVMLIVKKFGALCGRPLPDKSPEGFNFKLYLLKAQMPDLESLANYLKQIFPAVAAPPPAPPPSQSAERAPEPPQLVSLSEDKPRESVAAIAPLAQPSVDVPAKPLWGLEMPLDPKRSFEGLLVGSFNRFVHAAATSVVGSPGSMYNPLFIHGGPGVGKTHMLHAIGSGLAKTLSPESVALTSGARLARAVSQAAQAGRLAEIESSLKRKKVLMVDDIHLLAVSEATQGALAGIFDGFFKKNIQVVFTSIYPPRALGALEEALRISFGQGWSVDMRIPGIDVQKDILMGAFSRYGEDATHDETAMFQEKLGNNYPEAVCWVRRFAVFKKLRNLAGGSERLQQLLGALFEPAIPGPGGGQPTPAELEAARSFSPPAAGASAAALAVLVPKTMDGAQNWLASQFYAAKAKAGVSQDYRLVLAGSYDSEEPFGVPFEIGASCAAAGAEAVILLGPPAASRLAERTAEFSHAVERILESLDAALGWIPHSVMTSTVPFFHAHLDLAARRLLSP